MVRCLLALDMATTTGFAIWREGDPIPNESQANVLKLKHSDFGMRLAMLLKWLRKKHSECGFTDIACETPLASGGAGDDEQRFWLIGTYAVVRMFGAQEGVSVRAVANSTMFVHWVGTNNVEKKLRKAYSLVEAQRRGFKHVLIHDVADALGVLSVLCVQLNLTPPWDYKRSPGPLFTQAHAPHGTSITKANKIAAAKAINKGRSFNRGEG